MADCKGHEEWYDLVKRLVSSGIITDLDGDVVARYCAWWDGYLNILELNPAAYTDLTRCEAALQKLGSKLGLSPSDRAGLKINDNKEPEDNKSYSIKFG